MLVTSVTFAQTIPEKGVPFLENFAPAQYQNKGKIWDIKTAPNGMVYMAADKGLLEYDGKNWKSFKGSNGFTRSLHVVNDSLIYTGSDLDFGVWVKNKYQGFDYSSLYPFQKDLQEESEEFWHVHQINDDLVFASSQNIYVYKNHQLIKIPAPSGIVDTFWSEGLLYIVGESEGVFVFEDFKLRKLFDYPTGENPEIIAMYHNAQGMVVVTRDQGLFQLVDGNLRRLDNPLSDNLKTSKVFSFEKIGEKYVAFGTVLKGLWIADTDHHIIHQINRHKGLPGNTILSMHYSQAGKLWLGMDYGVTSLDLKNNFTYFYDYRGDFGTGYTALLDKQTFYLGTNQGAYHSGWVGLNNNLEFLKVQIIPGTEGQVWTLENIGNTVWMGHDKGLFIISESRAERIGAQEGVWTIVPYKDYLLTGNYNGISIYAKQGNQWTFLKKMDLILGSCNQLLVEKDNILWVNIPNFGIIRAVLNSDLHPEERLIFEERIFEGSEPYLLKDSSGIRVITNSSQYTWDESGKIFRMEDKPFLHEQITGLLPGIYKPVILNHSYEFFPVYNGFALKYLSADESAQKVRPGLILRKTEAFRNNDKRLVYNGSQVPFPFNNFRIECIVPNRSNVLYQYKIDDGEWSPWISENTFDISGLRSGDHKIIARASLGGEISDELTILIRVLPPWYGSLYAYAGYFLLFLMIILLMRAWRNRSLKKQKAALLIREKNLLDEQAEKHKQEILMLEQERLKSEFEQLKQQLKSKTIELAGKAKENEEKNRLILSLKESCEKALKNQSLSKIKLSEMHRILDSYLHVDDKTFEIQMDELHQDFFRKLKEQFPGLSNNDLRLCAYLKIGLNSKEIADILNIQPSSSYISRSRLRKKLDLKAEEDLYDFLNRI